MAESTPGPRASILYRAMSPSGAGAERPRSCWPGGPSTYSAFYRVNSVTVRDVAVRGTPAAQGIRNPVDCDVAFRFLNRRGVLDNVWFYGVSGATAVVSTYRCDLVVNGGGFLGCAATHKDVVHCDEWAGVTVRETEFLDFGSMHGAFHAKSSQNLLNTSRSWIGIFNPQMDLTQPVGGVNGSRCIRIENARFDEGTLNHVLIQPGAPGSSTEGGERRITAVEISGIPALVLSEAAARGFNINKVDHLTVRHCHFTAFNADGGERTAIQLADVRDTKFERVVATTNAGRIAAGAGCVSLLMEESAYTDLVVDPATRLRTVRDGQDSAGNATPKAAPGAPAITSVVAGSGSVSVTWTAPTNDGGSAVTGYEVRTYNANTNAELDVDAIGPTLSHQVTGLANGTPVYVKVAAVNAVGTGPQSTPSATVTPVAGATTTTAASSTTVAATTPTGLRVVSRTASTASIAWQGVAGASEYRAYVTRTSGSGYFLWASGFTGTSATLYSLTGDFYVVVRAVVGGVESGNSNEVLAAAA